MDDIKAFQKLGQGISFTLVTTPIIFGVVVLPKLKTRDQTEDPRLSSFSFFPPLLFTQFLAEVRMLVLTDQFGFQVLFWWKSSFWPH